MPDNPVVFESRRFFVRRQSVPAGTGTHVQDIVVHPGATAILPLLVDDRVVLIHNQRPAAGAELLELPAGTLEPNEAPALCAARELQEETGYTTGHIEPLCTFYTSPGILSEKMYAFVATDLTPGQMHPDPTERIRVTTLSFNDALAAIRTGDIIDGKTIAILLHYHCFRRQEG